MTKGITRRHALGLIAGASILPHVAQAAGMEAISGQAFGTSWQLVALPEADFGLSSKRSSEAVGTEINTLFAKIDRQFSPYRGDSLISQFNATHDGAFLQDKDFELVTQKALHIAKQSEGFFDPTVGPLVARWGFGPITTGDTPDWRGITAGPKGVGKTSGALTLDLCGIAKGWALDEGSRKLHALGLEDFLFDLGGELVAFGTHPSGRDWRVAIESAAADRPSPAALRLPSGMAVATSGITAQSYMLRAMTYGHIIDPRRGAQVQGRLRSVSVISEDAATADGWATALFAAGDKFGPEMAQAMELAAVFVFADGETRHTRAMAGFLV
ncbi:FAD:protein FMN transferase [Donghicola tyrosinivorans]|uniref:FAD:protein FMN transferase n=1 Tax=Donghicola tyrosinivorans TaxID=1652492 RepID=A0A2T0W9H3_9RHOB|nr:FAD:protein FMN transferase [Donghicola tyrosinivorans]PRY83362.1 thiamine biosynthesis lipoprotein [Donghicola tyrosinivorans]